MKLGKTVVVSFFFVIIGFLFAYKSNYVGNSTTSNSTLQELVLFIDNECFHIHHYIWISFLIFALYLGKYLNKNIIFNIIVAFLVGCALEGFMFKDWMLIKNNCHRKKIDIVFENNIA